MSSRAVNKASGGSQSWGVLSQEPVPGPQCLAGLLLALALSFPICPRGLKVWLSALRFRLGKATTPLSEFEQTQSSSFLSASQTPGHPSRIQSTVTSTSFTNAFGDKLPLPQIPHLLLLRAPSQAQSLLILKGCIKTLSKTLRIVPETASSHTCQLRKQEWLALICSCQW